MSVSDGFDSTDVVDADVRTDSAFDYNRFSGKMSWLGMGNRAINLLRDRSKGAVLAVCWKTRLDTKTHYSEPLTYKHDVYIMCL